MRKRNLLYLNVAELTEVLKEDFPEIFQMAQNYTYYTDFEERFRNYVYEIAYGFYGKKWDWALPIADCPVYSAAKRIFRTLQAGEHPIKNGATGELLECTTFECLWKGLRGELTDIHPDFLIDLYYLFCQLHMISRPGFHREEVPAYMLRWKTGMDDAVFYERMGNRMLLIARLVEKLENRPEKHSVYQFKEEMGYAEKQELVNQWWYDFRFQLTMAVRSPEELNRFLGHSLPPKTMEVLYEAERKGIPFFITPYYLSLLCMRRDGYDDEALRSYVIYSRELVENFGHIRAWEKEDEVQAGKPNAAGWILPNSRNIHRRYPEVAIFIPDTKGRACGGLCALCQRMYDFQRGRLNFDLDRLSPRESWKEKLGELMAYFENDAQLRDILITGGDALMSSNRALEEILEAICRMAVRKRDKNKLRKPGEKYAEIQRVRLGSRLPVYLPFRINEELVQILKSFREKAQAAGIRQFLIQTHFESPLEVTVEVRSAIHKLLSAGWLVTNRTVYTAASSRRGHAARLRQVLNRIGVITYYTFTVKGFAENRALYAPVSRSVQEQEEEKAIGVLSGEVEGELVKALEDPTHLRRRIYQLMEQYNLPFMATDRNVLNLPGIGKSMTFTTVGVTPEGKRVLCFTLDTTRSHSPALRPREKVYIVESKSLAAYLRQLEKFGEDAGEYDTIWYYNEGRTESRFKAYEYPPQPEGTTSQYTNIDFSA